MLASLTSIHGNLKRLIFGRTRSNPIRREAITIRLGLDYETIEVRGGVISGCDALRIVSHET